MDNPNHDKFRPIEFWKTSIMTLPDNAFFELVRTVLGKVKTPFSKQILVADLEKFLSCSDIQKNISSYIDKRDVRIIAAVAFLNEPTPAELGKFFSGDLGYAELNDQLVNLEERFILYRFLNEDKNQKTQHLALNPMFKQILSKFVANSSLLFPSIGMDELPLDEEHETIPNKDSQDKSIAIDNFQPSLLYDDRIPAVLLSFASMNEAFFKAKGEGIRQKVLNCAKSLFPTLPLETFVGSLQILGLLSVKDDRLISDYKRFSSFGKLSRQERAEYYTAGIFCHWESSSFNESEDPPNLSGSTVSPWLLRSKVRFYASFIHRFCALLDSDRLYSFASLKKLAYVLERENNDFSKDMLIEIMGKTGLLALVSGKYWRKQPFAPAPVKDEPAKPVIVMDTSFSLMVYPEIDYNDLVKIAAFSHVTESGLNVRFELNKDSAVFAFNLGITADSIIELLQRLSQNRIDESLIYTMRDWEKSHREVTLRHGVILTLSPERQYLAETRPLSTLITETLAPGIYLLPESLEDRVVRALQKAGVSIIARRESLDENRFSVGGGSFDSYSSSFYPTFRASSFNAMFPQAASNEGENKNADENSTVPAENDDEANVLIESFHSVLKKMSVDKEKYDELAARIDRRLILCESQIQDATLRYEKLEARGMDYAGKALIAKQAISLQSLVEVTWTVNKKQERIVGIPKTLEKTGSEAILVIREMDDEELVRIPLGKISLLRRIKRSIFETIIA